MKKRISLCVGLFFLLGTLSTVTVTVFASGQLSNDFSQIERRDSHLTTESASLPVSVKQYNDTHTPLKLQPVEDFVGYGAQLCQLPGFSCFAVKENQTWAALFPNEHQRELVMRLNRTNVALRYRRWIVVPMHWKSVDYISLSPLPEHLPTLGNKLILVDLRVFAFGAYDRDGDLIYWGPASGGRSYCDDIGQDCQSAVGRFKIYRIQGEQCKSSEYPLESKGGAPMPYCMHYYKGYAIHGSSLLGFVNRSRGCIRIFYSDAKWLNEYFAELGTLVVVKR